jgi:hypothetical protein
MGSAQDFTISTTAATGTSIIPTTGRFELRGVDIINPGFEASSIKNHAPLNDI